MVQLFGTEKNNVNNNTINKINTTTTTIVPTTTKMITTTVPTTKEVTTTSTSSTTSTTLIKYVNNIDISNNENIVKKNEVTLLKNIAPVLNKQSLQKNQNTSLELKAVYETINIKTTKAINNSFGVGLLFLGIFGIINISREESISNIFKKRLLIKNTLVLIIGLGFLLNNITSLIYKIQIPTI